MKKQIWPSNVPIVLGSGTNLGTWYNSTSIYYTKDIFSVKYIYNVYHQLGYNVSGIVLHKIHDTITGLTVGSLSSEITLNVLLHRKRTPQDSNFIRSPRP